MLFYLEFKKYEITLNYFLKSKSIPKFFISISIKTKKIKNILKFKFKLKKYETWKNAEISRKLKND